MTLKQTPIIAGEGRWHSDVALVDYRRVWRPVGTASWTPHQSGDSDGWDIA
jgi:hypothetical protein